MLDGSNFEPDTHEPIPPTPRGIFGWTEAAEEHLRRRWGTKGASAAVIAKELGTSRNSVIGKAHRLGMHHPDGERGNAKTRVRRANPQRAKAQKDHDQKQIQSIVIRRLRTEQEYESVEAASMAFAEPCSLIGLREDSCRWPVGFEAPYLFCNAEAVLSRPYCSAHCAIAYERPRPRKAYVPAPRRAA